MYTIASTSVLAIAQLTGKVAIDDTNVIKSGAVRYASAVPMIFAVMFVSSGGDPAPRMTPVQLALAAAIAITAWVIGSTLYFEAMRRDSMHRLSPISNSVGIWASIFAIVFLKEKFFPALGASLVLLVAGIVMMAPAAKSAARWKWAIPSGILVSILWAGTITLTKVALTGISVPSAFVFIKISTTAVVLTIIAFFIKGPITKKSIFYSVFSGALLVVGDTLMMFGVKGLPASVFSPLYTTVIPFGFIASVLLLKEKPTTKNWFGMLLIFLAAAICGYYGAFNGR